MEISLLFPDWVEGVSIVLKCEVRDFSCCLVKTLTDSIQCTLNELVCVWGTTWCPMKISYGASEDPGCTNEGSGFTGCTFDIAS